MSRPEVTADEFKRFSAARIFIPVAIGLAVSALFIYFNPQTKSLTQLNLNGSLAVYILLAVGCMLVSNLALAYRFMLVSEGSLTLKSAIVLTLIYQFACNVLPAIVASTIILFILLVKEDIPAGKAIFITVVSSIFDMILFTIGTPLIIYTAGWDNIFGDFKLESSSTSALLSNGTQAVFWWGYTMFVLGLLLYSYGLFRSPQLLKRGAQKYFARGLRKRIQPGLLKMFDDLITANAEMKSFGAGFWIKGMLATLVIWLFKYLSANVLIAAVSTNAAHFTIIAKQTVMYMIMMTIPTPGGAGTAELIFIQMMSVYLHTGMAGVIALLWRTVSYYLFIVTGALLLPRWLEQKFFRAKGV